MFCLYTFFRTQCDSVLKSIYPSLTVITSNPFVEIVFLIFVIGINLLAKFTVVIVDIVLITGFTKKSVFTRFYSRTNLFMNLFRTTKPIKTFPRWCLCFSIDIITLFWVTSVIVIFVSIIISTFIVIPFAIFVLLILLLLFHLFFFATLSWIFFGWFWRLLLRNVFFTLGLPKLYNSRKKQIQFEYLSEFDSNWASRSKTYWYLKVEPHHSESKVTSELRWLAAREAVPPTMAVCCSFK